MEPSFQVFDTQAARYDAWFDSERGRALLTSEGKCLQELTAHPPQPWLEVGVDQAASTLLRAPRHEFLAAELARNGRQEGAGSVALLRRRQAGAAPAAQ